VGINIIAIVNFTYQRNISGCRKSLKLIKAVDDLNNINLLPFERNRYYPGKLLTSADFLSEQLYVGNKRRFMNSLLYGEGIVCGLSVQNLDDTSLMVESGVAVDGQGRESVLENSIVRKLSAIEGYDVVNSNRLVLCLAYDESDIQPVYAVGSSDKESGYEMNRIRESSKIFLADADSLEEDKPLESSFLTSATIYSDSDYAVSITMPATVPSGHGVNAVIRIEKLSDEDKSIQLTGVFGAPAFTYENNGHEFNVNTPEIKLANGKIRSFSYSLTSRSSDAAETIILGKPEDIHLKIDGEEKAITDSVMLHLAIVKESPEYIIERELAKVSLEARSLNIIRDYVKLAEITVERNNNTAIITGVKETDVKHYIPTIARDSGRREYALWFTEEAETLQQSGNNEQATTSFVPLTRDPIYATGICEIPLGSGDKRGEVHYSGEVIHGLGAGDVHVDVGFECLTYDAKLDKPAKTTIYGSPSLWEAEELPIPNAELGVRVLNERGSFIVATRMNEQTDFVVLLVRWVATKLPNSENLSIVQQLESDASISPMLPTIVVSPNESRFIDVRFKNMSPVALSYELTEKNAGQISVDGIYTASNKEGVHEIHIYSSDNPFISTYAYVVVKKKDSEDHD
jgi:hypothetical protein